MSCYATLLKQLLSLARGRQGRLNLTIIEALCRKIGSPQNQYRHVHIAGTNGKGSVSTMVAAGLATKYSRVGLYTSPHIATFRERIRINGIPISIPEVEEFLPPILTAVNELELPASFFEVTTALMFTYFAARNIDIAVLETGLGGRLDATNIVNPILSVITSISYDHTEILGASLEEIAREKGGIIKATVPVVVGPTVPTLIDIMSAELAAPLHRIERNFTDYRAENRAIANRALELLSIDSEGRRQALEALPPCRFEQYTSTKGVDTLFDVAHNAAGLQSLAYLIKELWGERRCQTVIAISATKDLKTCLSPLCNAVEHWYPVVAQNGRSHPASAVSETLQLLGVDRSRITFFADDTAMTTAHAHDMAKETDAPLLICGSFFIMAAARRALGIADSSDPYDLNEWNSIQPINR